MQEQSELLTLKIKDILINENNPNMRRGRVDFGEIERLAESINEYGLMHPIVVEKLSTPIEGKNYVLIAGERRLRAHIMLGKDEIKATFRENETSLRRKAMELEENVIRKNLDWQEEFHCIRQLHELKQLEFGVPIGDPTGKVTGWGVRDTANLLNRSIGSVSQAITISKELESNPEVANKVKNVPRAVAAKVIKRMIEDEKLKKEVSRKGIKIGVELLHGNCVDLIKSLPDESIDCLLTDPPFASPKIVKLAKDSHNITYNITESNVSNLETILPTYDELFPQLAKKLKVGAHFYIFCGMGEHYCYLVKLMNRYGFLYDDLPLIWNKNRGSVVPKDYSYVSSYEPIIFGHFGKRVNRLEKPVNNVLTFEPIPPSKRVHPLQRPEDLLRLLIKNSTLPGQTVLDCFAGSGSTLKVARDLHRKAIGFELDEGNYLRALKWLTETSAENEDESQ